MEELFFSQLAEKVLSGESPSGVVMCAILGYILYMLKGFKRDVRKMSQEISEIRCSLLGLNRQNVIRLDKDREIK